MVTPTLDPMIEQAEVRRRLGDISETTLRRWIRRGGFPPGMQPIPGGKKRWRASVVDRWLDQQHMPTTGDAA